MSEERNLTPPLPRAPSRAPWAWPGLLAGLDTLTSLSKQFPHLTSQLSYLFSQSVSSCCNVPPGFPSLYNVGASRTLPWDLWSSCTHLLGDSLSSSLMAFKCCILSTYKFIPPTRTSPPGSRHSLMSSCNFGMSLKAKPKLYPPTHVFPLRQITPLCNQSFLAPSPNQHALALQYIRPLAASHHSCLRPGPATVLLPESSLPFMGAISKCR